MQKSWLIFILALCAVFTSAQAALPANATPAVQDPALVVAEVEDFLHSQASTYPGSVQVTVETPRIQNQQACDQLQAYLPSGQRLRSRMSVGVRCVEPAVWTSHVKVTLSIQGYYYVANRNMDVGEVVSLDDMAAREGDILRLARNIVFDPSQVVGYITSQRIRAGSPIKSSALRDPESIQRGQVVRTEARGAGFVATGEGQALQSGAPGTQIQVRASSGQVISGVVVNAHTVRIIM
ncbi:flagellar basal body P-ring formation chaperone FlgA [Pollutimonas harenae]|uniref:Flagella basal body P-ring formation protein FlgA n=1 Tax=Pollutimonas harenae TaxID=657015 RepID=A0A853H4D2_9BURK|nr:flagellar basal body P-ring formation chaperone FlgA [Pollutimonas harenae]NYT87072.1 flagellar basal body P-ring formation protein FlgA [Pollutimonas harenae]TEA71291.1 flagellar basal body P-ring formation protein FlgA [Pollutimonas harenae]